MAQKALSLLFTACSLFAVSLASSYISLAQRIPPDIQNILKNLPPDTLQNMIKENEPKGEMTFAALPPQQYFKTPAGAAAKFQPYEQFLQSGAAVAYEFEKCIVEGEETAYIKNIFVLYLDEEKMDSTFTTDQKSRTASIMLKGQIDRWSGKCNSDELRRSGKGKGGLELSFTNTLHLKPRFFQSGSVTGKMFGAGLNETIRSRSKMGEPIASSYAKSENKSSYDPKLLAALRKAGMPIPDVDPEQLEKTAEEYMRANGYTLDLSKPSFYGKVASPRQITVNGSPVPAVQVDFGISSGFEADMLVYKPEGMSAATGGRSSGAQTPPERPLTYGAWLINAGYSPANYGALNRPTQQAPGGGELIPDSLQNSLGAQAFVNLDNDNKDKTFDLEDAEKSSENDDDLVKVVLRVKKRPEPQRKGVGKFETKQGEDFVKVWEKDKSGSKLIPFSPRDLSEANDFKEGTGDFAGFVIKELWVEGVKPHSSQRATTFRFTYYENSRALELAVDETFAMTVIGIAKIELVAKENGTEFVDHLITKPSDQLGPDPNHKHPDEQLAITTSMEPKGVRVFPGKRLLRTNQRNFDCKATVENVLDREPRDKIDVIATLSVKPVEPVKVYFDSFDVDDPTAAGSGTPGGSDNDNESWIDDEDQAKDNRGEIEGAFDPGAGKFPGESNTDGILEVEFDDTEKTFLFQVTMQPGDNFRIVGSGDRDFLKDLENDDKKLNVGGAKESNKNKQRIVHRDVLNANRNAVKDAEIRDPDKYASKTLAVWRLFYGERDYMGNVQGNSVEGTIVAVSPAIFSSQTTVQLGKNIRIALGLTNERGLENSFENGKLKVGGAEYKIIGNTADFAGHDSITVSGRLSRDLVNQAYEIVDDDKDQYNNGIYHFGNGGQLWQPNVTATDRGFRNGVDMRYQPAYIASDFGTLKNPCPGPKFSLNVAEDNSDSYKTHYRFDNIATHDSKDFWTVYVLGSFQATPWEDGDPNSEGTGGAASGVSGITAGIIDDDRIGATIFLACVIEKLGGVHANRTVAGTGEQDAVVHEIGHLFNAQHGQGKLMDQKGTTFSSRSIKAIRESRNP